MHFTQQIEFYAKLFGTIDTVALFGSSTRGDFDHISDKDLLLISNDKISLKNAKNLFEKLGYSCSCYNWNKLKYMSAQKALFIQHLKQESFIILDKSNSLGNVLRSYEPARDYSQEIDMTKSLVSLTERFPSTPIGAGWALDILAVGFRNLAILSLANEGKYIFSYENLLSTLMNRGFINAHQKYILSRLRKYKVDYRNKNFQAIPSKEKVFETQNILCEIFDIELCPETVSEESFQYYCLLSEKALEVSNWYLQTRLCEGAFMSWQPLAKPYEDRYSNRLSRVREAITNPSCYSFLFSFPSGNLRSEILNLIGLSMRKAA